MADFPARGGLSRSSRLDGAGCLTIAVGILTVLIVVFFVIYGISQVNTRGEMTNCHVTGKDRVAKYKGGSDMRIYTENCGTLQVKDTIVGKTNFNSADLYASITVNDNYDFKTRGFRFGLFSDFPIILEATKV